MKNLYTFILDFEGGTYVSQLEEESVNKAIISWIKEIDAKTLKIKNIKKTDILKDMTDIDEKPSLLVGMANVWCVTFLIKNRLAIVNIIKTHKQREKEGKPGAKDKKRGQATLKSNKN